MARFCPLLLLVVACSEFRPREGAATATACALEPCETIGANSCAGDLVRVCVDTGAGCVGWSAAAACPTVGERCAGAGVCGADACPTGGATQCQGPTGTITCVASASGFLDWAPYQSCPAGTTCAADVCVPVACDKDGVRVCGDDGISFRTCETKDGVLGWSERTVCGDGKLCAGTGNCGVNECAATGAAACDGAARTKTCAIGDDGFRHYGASVACPAGQLCGPTGECGAHECGPKGAIECDGDGAVKECVVGSAGFLVWATSVPCSEGLHCGPAGACGKDACPADGTAECTDDGHRKVCHAGGLGFLLWSEPEACPPKSLCLVDTCVADECAGVGALECTDATHLRECVKAPNGVFVWGEPEPCQGTAVCKAQGVCGKDQCPADGVTVCDGAASTKTCHAGPSEFLFWDPPVPCPAPANACKAGLCGQDLCTPGDASCQGGLQVTCAAGPDGFTAFAAPAPCPDTETCLGAGHCTPLGEVELWSEAARGRPDVRATAAGFAVVFTGSVAGGTSVFLRRFAADGQALEDAHDVSGVLAVSPPFPTVVALPDEGPDAVAVVWLAASDGTLRMRRWLSPDVKPEPVVAFKPASPFATDPLPRSVLLSPGHVGILDVEGEKQVIRLTVTDSVSVSGGPFALGSVPAGPVTGLAAASLPKGGGLVAWTVGGQINETTSHLAVVPVLESGDVDAAPLELTVDVGNPGRPSVAVAPDGTGFVVYDVGVDVASAGVRGRRFSADGSAQGAEIHVNEVTPGDQRSPAVTALPGGLWWVVWQGPDVAENGIYGRVFDTAGKPLATDEAVNLTTEDTQEDPATCALSDGRRVVVWRSGKGGAARMKARFLDVVTAPP